MSRKKVLDAFPNYLSGELTLSAQNTFTTTRVNTPIPRIATSGRNPTIMEILWVDWQPSALDLIADSDLVQAMISVGSVPTTMLGISDGSVLTKIVLDTQLTTSGETILKLPLRSDLQSTDGYGQLLASDAFHVSASSTGQAAATVWQWRLYYRFVQVPVTEYIGIVQSEQSS